MRFLIFIIILISFFSCKQQEKKQQIINSKFTNSVKYATGFKFLKHLDYNELILQPNTKNEQHVIFVKNEKEFYKKGKYTIFNKPVSKIVVTSTTHIPMLELLDETNSLVGFPNAKYISSEKTRKLIDAGKIIELGNEQNINTELLLNLQPDVVIGFSMGNNNKTFDNIKKAGIPVLINNDWLEKTPLGRAEWIKFFGVIYGKTNKADNIFNTIEAKYNEAKKIALSAKTKPKILAGVLYKDKWNLPAGESYVAQFLKDANVNYPWQNTNGSGSLSLAFESVFDTAKDADYWIAPGYYQSYSQLEKSNQHYQKFDAFKNKKIYNFTKRKGKTGGILYYELAPVQPDVVLKDLIKILHPELLNDYTPFYLENLTD